MSVGRCITSRRTVLLSLLVCLVFLTFPAQMADGFLKTRLDVLFNKQIHKRHLRFSHNFLDKIEIRKLMGRNLCNNWDSEFNEAENYCKSDKLLNKSYYNFPTLESTSQYDEKYYIAF